MSCTNCNQSNTSSFSVPFMQVPNTGNSIDTRNSVYTGPELLCLGVSTNTCLQDIIQSIDSKVCQSVGNYSQYNFNCLSSSYVITDEASFVNAITNYACVTRLNLNTLTTLVNSNYTALNSLITDTNSPSLTSPCTNIVYNTSSTLKQVITAQSNAICGIYSQLALTGVVWNGCFTVTTPPTTIVAGFQEVLNQICQVKASITSSGTLPVFDNTGTCLASPTTTDSLVDTIIKIRTRVCQTPTFIIGNLNSSTCVGFTSTSTLEDVLDSQNAQIDNISQNSIRSVSSDFTLNFIDPLQPCLGKTIALNSSVVDRSVALDNTDTTPGNLSDKITQGNNITLDFGVINPGKLTISATGGITTDEKVKVNNSDSTPGFLQDKITGNSSTGVTVSIVPISGSSQLQVTAVLDFTAIATQVLNIISSDPTLKAMLCSLNASCPSPCSQPTNVQAIQVS